MFFVHFLAILGNIVKEKQNTSDPYSKAMFLQLFLQGTIWSHIVISL